MRKTATVRWMISLAALYGTTSVTSFAQSPDSRAFHTTSEIQARLRPLGEASAVDRYTRAVHPVRQVALMQATGDRTPVAPPSLPSSGFSFPGNTGVPATSPPTSAIVTPTAPPTTTAVPSAPPNAFAPPASGGLPVPLRSAPVTPIGPSNESAPLPPSPSASLPRSVTQGSTQPGLPINPNVSPGIATPRGPNANGVLPRTTLPSPSTSPGFATDYHPIAQPQLGNAFATIDNCRNISPPSGYRAGGIFGCDPMGASTNSTYGGPGYGSQPVVYTPPPSQIAPAIALPPGATFPVGATGSTPPVIPGSPGYRPLISFGQERNPVQVGQGIWGQPVAYVPGQTFRNALRYIAF